MLKRELLTEKTIIELDSKPYRKAMHQYFTYNDWEGETSITNVLVTKEKDETVITITTHRPGILIGKAGCFIDGLSKWLNEKFDEKIKLSIKECDLWMNLYR